jgi:hypothetical protein
MTPTIIPHCRAMPHVLREVPTSDSLLSHFSVSHTAFIAAHETGMRRIAGSLPGALLVCWSRRPLAGEADRRGAGPR